MYATPTRTQVYLCPPPHAHTSLQTLDVILIILSLSRYSDSLSRTHSSSSASGIPVPCVISSSVLSCDSLATSSTGRRGYLYCPHSTGLTQNVLAGLYETQVNKSDAVDLKTVVRPGIGLSSLLYTVPMASRSASALRSRTGVKVCLLSADVYRETLVLTLYFSQRWLNCQRYLHNPHCFLLSRSRTRDAEITQACGAAAKLYETIDRVPTTSSAFPTVSSLSHVSARSLSRMSTSTALPVLVCPSSRSFLSTSPPARPHL